jgi:hypothetical protein
MTKQLTEGLEIDGRVFRFKLCRKAGLLGPVPIDHWWMDLRTLYGQRNRPAINHDAIVDYYRALCRHHGSDDEIQVRESYVLAKLLPRVRSHASRRIFKDAYLFTRGPATWDVRDRAVADLEVLLQAGGDHRLAARTFRDETAKILGPPRLGQVVAACYEQFTTELLSEACARLGCGDEGGLDIAFRRWDEAMRVWGRRRGFPVEKQVLDVISYECRAAFHRCYSATWCELLRHLTERHGLDHAGQDFHAFWHLDQIQNPERDVPDRFDLFHGHVFALHAAGALLLQTQSGRALVGEWLVASEREGPFCRILNALLIAAYSYWGLHDEIAALRRDR